MKHFELISIQRHINKRVIMFKKLIVGVGALSLVLVGCKQPKCENEVCPEKPLPISLQECSPHLQTLIQNHKSHIRGLKVGTPLSGVSESDSNFVSKTSFYTSFSPDLDINYWAQIDYHYNENNIVDKVETEVIPGGLTPQENAVLVDSLYFEMREYLSGKYGNAVTNTDYRLIWNDVDVNNNSLTIFSLDYEVPEEETSIYVNDVTGETDTVDNPPTVKYIVKYLE